MKKIVHDVGLDVHKETIAVMDRAREVVAGSRYTRFARPASPESDEVFGSHTPGGERARVLTRYISFAPTGLRNDLRLALDKVGSPLARFLSAW